MNVEILTLRIISFRNKNKCNIMTYMYIIINDIIVIYCYNSNNLYFVDAQG